MTLLACFLQRETQLQTDSRPHSWSLHHVASVRKGQSHHMLPIQSHVTELSPTFYIVPRQEENDLCYVFIVAFGIKFWWYLSQEKWKRN